MSLHKLTKLTNMKKAFFFLAVMALAATAVAQRKFFTEICAGTNSYLSYSNLSLFPASEKNYTTISEAFTLGRRGKHIAYGLKLDETVLNTSATAFDENYSHTSLSLFYRDFWRFNERFEAFLGMSIGAYMANNSLTLGGNVETYQRWGIVSQYDCGLNYNINEKKYIGLHISYAHGTQVSSLPTLPVNNAVSDSKVNNSLQARLAFGIRF